MWPEIWVSQHGALEFNRATLMAVACDCHWIMRWNSLDASTQVWNSKWWKDVTAPPKLFKEITVAKELHLRYALHLSKATIKIADWRLAGVHTAVPLGNPPALGRLPARSAHVFEGMVPWRLRSPSSFPVRLFRCFLIMEGPFQGVIFSKEARMPHTCWSGVTACPWVQSSSSFCRQLLTAGGHFPHGTEKWQRWPRLPKGKSEEKRLFEGGVGWELHPGGSHGAAAAVAVPPQCTSSAPLCSEIDLELGYIYIYIF